MLTALHRLFRTLPSNVHALDHLLPKIAQTLGEDFIHWVDGGAGVGTTSKHYASILGPREQARVYCYEPLPENFRVLTDQMGGQERFVLRDVAVSDAPGEATFVIPKRVTGKGAGDWVAGTSWGGSLKFPSGPETITVKTVRLADEPIPRFDFVKLDLQGGELDALRGMGERIAEAKLLYVETQILSNWQNSLGLLHDHGFITFYDRMQIGLTPGTKLMPFEAFKKCGIVIDRMLLPQDSGVSLICWGYFDVDAGALDPNTFVFSTDAVKCLRDAGVHYIQTDTIAVNPREWRRMAPLLG